MQPLPDGSLRLCPHWAYIAPLAATGAPPQNAAQPPPRSTALGLTGKSRSVRTSSSVFEAISGLITGKQVAADDPALGL